MQHREDDPSKSAWIKSQYKLANGATFTQLRPGPRDEPSQHLTGHGKRLVRVDGHTLALPHRQASLFRED